MSIPPGTTSDGFDWLAATPAARWSCHRLRSAQDSGAARRAPERLDQVHPAGQLDRRRSRELLADLFRSRGRARSTGNRVRHDRDTFAVDTVDQLNDQGEACRLGDQRSRGRTLRLATQIGVVHGPGAPAIRPLEGCSQPEQEDT